MLCGISLAGVLSKCVPPDTIPNSEVKALRPDDSLSGESRVRRHMKSSAETQKQKLRHNGGAFVFGLQ